MNLDEIYQHPKAKLCISEEGIEEIYEDQAYFQPSSNLAKLALEICVNKPARTYSNMQDILAERIESIIGLMSAYYAPYSGTLDIILIEHSTITPQFRGHIERKMELELDPSKEHHQKFLNNLAQELYTWIQHDSTRLQSYGLFLTDAGNIVLRCTPTKPLGLI